MVSPPHVSMSGAMDFAWRIGHEIEPEWVCRPHHDPKIKLQFALTELDVIEKNIQDRAFSLSVVSDAQHSHEMNADDHIKVFILLICRGGYFQVDSTVLRVLRHTLDPS